MHTQRITRGKVMLIEVVLRCGNHVWAGAQGQASPKPQRSITVPLDRMSMSCPQRSAAATSLRVVVTEED
jgi:hypothetical protein